MAGFYGNISASNRTAFTFDKIYSTRKQMDEAAATDGIFLGRYVLVEYDNPPLTGYYNSSDGEFYGDVHYNVETRMEKIANQLYQDLASLNSTQSFYLCQTSDVNNTLIYVQYTGSASSFAASYNIDVQNYGRGYDSTAWMKMVDSETNKYRYILVAEMNTVVPNFHLVVDPPSGTPYGPYFDNSTTNLDYYMHIQAPYAHRLNTQTNPNLSDEAINFQVAEHDDSNNSWSIRTYYNQPGDIFYNKAGFNDSVSNHADNINYINYQLVSSGKQLYGVDNAATTNTGLTATDTYLWSIHLPVIGNTIASVWDIMFNTDRKRAFLLESHENLKADPALNTVTVDTPTVLGLTNSMRCYMGRVYRMPSETDLIDIENDNDHYSHFTIPGGSVVGAGGSGGTLTFNKAVLFVDYINKERCYYYPNFTSMWTEDPNGEYIIRDGAYVIANKIAHPEGPFYSRSIGAGATLAEQENQPHWRYTFEYSDNIINSETKTAAGLAAVAADRGRLNGAPHTIQGALAAVNRVLGLNLSQADSRDDRTAIGMINRMKDVIANIDTQIVPHKFIVSSSDGVITASTTDFPYAGTGNHQELLDSSGTWRLPVSYKLETLDLTNENDHTKYFDGAYFGNSCLHAVLATDTLGEAIRKMQNEMADLQYEPQTIDSFTVTTPVLSNNGTKSSSGTLLEHGASSADITISYSLNKGPRQSIEISRINPTGTSYSNTTMQPNDYVTNREAYLATASGSVNETITLSANAPKWTLRVIDERSYQAEKTAELSFAWRAYWGVSTAHAANEFSTASAVVNLLTKNYGDKLATNGKPAPAAMSPGANEYMYYICINTANPVFKVGGFEGGFDKLGTVTFTNAVGGSTTYAVWRSTKANLGTTTVTVS